MIAAIASIIPAGIWPYLAGFAALAGLFLWWGLHRYNAGKTAATAKIKAAAEKAAEQDKKTYEQNYNAGVAMSSNARAEWLRKRNDSKQ
jgi:hypothetical protein